MGRHVEKFGQRLLNEVKAERKKNKFKKHSKNIIVFRSRRSQAGDRNYNRDGGGEGWRLNFTCRKNASNTSDKHKQWSNNSTNSYKYLYRPLPKLVPLANHSTKLMQSRPSSGQCTVNVTSLDSDETYTNFKHNRTPIQH